MNLIKLYELTNKEKINVIEYSMKKTKARIINYNGYNIFMDYKRINTYTEEKCLLAEELAHYYHNAFYTFNSSKTEIERQEFKAFKWKSLVCVPLESILRGFKKGYTNLYDLAEYLQVEPNMVEFAYNYYKENKLIS